jgi:hypothetical protein
LHLLDTATDPSGSRRSSSSSSSSSNARPADDAYHSGSSYANVT